MHGDCHLWFVGSISWWPNHIVPHKALYSWLVQTIPCSLAAFQKKIVRIICGVPPRTHTDPLYKDLKILNIDQIRDYSIALFMYKLSHHMLPSMFENMFIYTSDVHDYYTRQADLLYIQYAPTKRSQRTIKYYGTKLWNIISVVVQPDCAISTFKQKLKIFLLSWLGSLPFFLISNYVSFHLYFFFFQHFPGY